MANTFTQIHIHAVFAVKTRVAFIKRDWQDELYKYITGIVRQNGHQLLIINGMADHVHIFFGMRPIQSLADLMQDIKSGSSKWINDKNLVPGQFQWQQGYGAFSYSRSHVQRVIDYIARQEEHHSKFSFAEEYKNLLNEFDVDYDEKYIFKEPE